MQAVSRKTIMRILIVSLTLSLLLLAAVLFTTRWSPDREWAAKVVIESGEIRDLLDEFRKSQGEFPSSLEELNASYRQPTDYQTRNGSTPEKGRWFYERIGKEDFSSMPALAHGYHTMTPWYTGIQNPSATHGLHH